MATNDDVPTCADCGRRHWPFYGCFGDAAIDARVFVAIVDVIHTATYPGIKTPRGYALRAEVETKLADTDITPQALYNSLQRLHNADKIGHYYDRDGMRLYLKGTR